MQKPRSLVLVGAFAFLAGPGRALTVPEEVTATPQQVSTEASPGLRLTSEEKSRGTQDGLEVVRYVFKADGFPGDKSYVLVGKRMDGKPQEVARGFRIGESGRVLDPDGDEFVLSLGRLFRGEYVVFALISEDGASKAFVELTPYPIEAEGKGGCRLSVRPMMLSGQMFQINGSGFEPNKKLKIVSFSSNEVARSSAEGRPDGTLKHVILPAVVGKTGGDASFAASDSACEVKVDYKWGDAMRSLPPAPPKSETPTS